MYPPRLRHRQHPLKKLLPLVLLSILAGLLAGGVVGLATRNPAKPALVSTP